MSEKTSRKNFLFASGTVVAGWLAYCGLRRTDARREGAVVADAKLPVTARPEPRAVPVRRA